VVELGISALSAKGARSQPQLCGDGFGLA